MRRYGSGAVWQDVETGRRNWSAWQRIALVTDHAWMRDGLRMFAGAVPAEVRAFRAGDRAEAIEWAAATREKS
ncbi:STAS/SEC14 domain-containing protein [Actinoplanes sp. KI2]|uniref:STAS/SEC14 domain-containing protein n=1 Tax=Actinoplanes sp. KI2 TaxID=2983315 RepID=UPI003983B5F1